MKTLRCVQLKILKPRSWDCSGLVRSNSTNLGFLVTTPKIPLAVPLVSSHSDVLFYL